MNMNTLALILALLGAPAFALAPGDGVVVNFKDGSSMSGVLVKQGKKKIRLDIGGAQISFLRDTVKSVKPKVTNVKRFQEMLKAAGDDRGKLLQAADFARSRGLDTYYSQLVERLGIPNQNDIEDARNEAIVEKNESEAADALVEMNEHQAASQAAMKAARQAEREAKREAKREQHAEAQPDVSHRDPDRPQ
jgi:hypothetical protein